MDHLIFNTPEAAAPHICRALENAFADCDSEVRSAFALRALQRAVEAYITQLHGVTGSGIDRQRLKERKTTVLGAYDWLASIEPAAELPLTDLQRKHLDRVLETRGVAA